MKPKSHKHQQERSIMNRSWQQYPGEIAAGGTAMPDELPSADHAMGGTLTETERKPKRCSSNGN